MCVFMLSTGKSFSEEVPSKAKHPGFLGPCIIEYLLMVCIVWLNVTRLHPLQRNDAHSQNCGKTCVSIFCPYSHSIFWDLSEWLVAISSRFYGYKHGFVVGIDHGPEKRRDQSKSNKALTQIYCNQKMIKLLSKGYEIIDTTVPFTSIHQVTWHRIQCVEISEALNADYLTKLVENSMQIPSQSFCHIFWCFQKHRKNIMSTPD